MLPPRSAYRLLGVGAGVVLLATATAQAGTYQIDPAHSSIEFSIRHLVGRTSGGFTGFAGTVAYDPADPAKSSVQVTIQASTINTHNEQRDAHLRNADFLGVEKFPEITFKSSKVEKQGDRLMVTGDLALHGVTRTIQLSVEVLGVGTHPMRAVPVAGFATETTLKRSDYGVNSWVDPAGVLGDEVKVTIAIEALGEAAK